MMPEFVENVNDSLENLAVSATEQTPEIQSESVTEEPPEATAEEAPFEYPVQHNDATVLGYIPEHVKDIPLKLASAANTKKFTKWPVTDKAKTYYDLIDWLSRHVEGEKDGRGFAQGTFVGNERKASAADAFYVIGGDVDSGMSPQTAIDALIKHGLTGIVYTTHSHLKRATFLSENAFNQWRNREKIDHVATEAPIDHVKRYLLEARHWESWLVETISVPDERSHTGNGMGWLLSHDPMPKFRFVIPLAEPYIIAKQTMSQAEAGKLWKRKLVGLAKLLELPIDEACLDLARLFYLPRHDKNREFGVWVTGGNALDFSTIPEVAVQQGGAQKPTNEFAQAGEALAGKDGPDFVIDGNFSLKRWAREVAHDFDIATMVRTVAPGLIRNDQNTSKVTIACPFDHFHGNAGDPDDEGCYVQSPLPETGLNSFVFQCSHNSCKGRDRLEFVAEAVKQGWFTKDDLENDDFQLFVIEETEEQKLANLKAKIDLVTRDTRRSDLDPIFAELGALDISDSRRNDLFEKICELNGVANGNDKRSLKGRMTPYVKAADAQRDKGKQTEAEGEALQKIQKKAGDKPVLVPKEMGFMPCVDAAFTRLMAVNETKPTYFDMGGQKIVMNKDSRGDVKSYPLEPAIMLTELDHECVWMTPEGDKDYVPSECPPRVANDIINYRKREFPRLERVSRVPFFTTDGECVATEGYHAKSGIYCVLAPEMANLSIPDHPTDEQVADAVSFVNENLFEGFPFNDGDGNGDASRANAWAFFLERYVRELIGSFVPIYMIDKIQKGTGGSLLAQSIMSSVLGKPQGAQPHKKNEEEQQKVMTSFLLEGGEFFFIDNLQNKLAGAVLAMAVTLREWQDRILGSNKMANVPIRNSWCVVGNQLQLDEEISRRCVPIKLAMKGDPTKRDPKSFKHKNLDAWVLENRGKLVECALIIIQSWIANGKPAPVGAPHLSSYEPYVEIMGGILQNAKINGFLENLHLAKAAAQDDRWLETEVLRALFARFGGEPREIGDPDEDAKADDVRLRPDEKKNRTSFISVLIDAGITSIPTENGNELDLEDVGINGLKKAQRLGMWFKKKKLVNVAIEIAPGLDVALEIIPTTDRKRNPRGKSNLYCVECVGWYPKKATDYSRRLFGLRVFDWEGFAAEFEEAIDNVPDWTDELAWAAEAPVG